MEIIIILSILLWIDNSNIYISFLYFILIVLIYAYTLLIYKMEYYSFILIILYVSALLILFAITIMMNKQNVIIVKQIKWSYLFLLLYFLPFNTEDILMLYDYKYPIIEQIGLNIFSEYFSLIIVLLIFIILLFVLFTILLLL